MQAQCTGSRQVFFLQAIEAGQTPAQANATADQQVYECQGWSNVYAGAVMALGAPHHAAGQLQAEKCTKVYGVMHEIGCFG
jgi:hypothetical protein